MSSPLYETGHMLISLPDLSQNYLYYSYNRQRRAGQFGDRVLLAAGISSSYARLLKMHNELFRYEHACGRQIFGDGWGWRRKLPSLLAIDWLIKRLQLNWQLGQRLLRESVCRHISWDKCTRLNTIGMYYCGTQFPERPSGLIYPSKYQTSQWIMSPNGLAVVICLLPENQGQLLCAPIWINDNPQFDQFMVFPASDVWFASKQQIESGIRRWNDKNGRNGWIEHPLGQIGDGLGVVYKQLSE